MSKEFIDPYRLFEMYGNRVCNERLHTACRNCHVFMNMATYPDTILEYVKENHRVHIFVSTLPLENESFPLSEFISKAYAISKRKVIIHVGKSTLAGTHLLSEYIKMYLDLDKMDKEYKLVISDSDVYMTYRECDFYNHTSGIRFICSKRDHKYSATRYIIM